jgi:WD40 repeat protein
MKIEDGKLQGHDDSVLSLTSSLDNKMLISGGSDATFRIWTI